VWVSLPKLADHPNVTIADAGGRKNAQLASSMATSFIPTSHFGRSRT
jgi:hypothetical protein